MIDTLSLGIISIVILILLIVIRMPIAYAMILVGGLGSVFLDGSAMILNQLKSLAYGQFSIYDLTVVPMFVLMGAVATRIGLSQTLFHATGAWVGWMRGGMAMSAILSCAGFGAVCGSSLATVSTMGKVALPELRKRNYSRTLATGTLAAGGVLGILIPPSVVLVIYAIIVEASIVDLFIAAFIPGIIAVIFFMLTIAIYVRLKPDAGPREPKPTAHELWQATLGAMPVMVIFMLVIGGIYFGFFNPTPAATIGVFLVILYGIINKQLILEKLRDSIQETASTTGMIYLILLGAELLKIYMSRLGLPQEVASYISTSGLSPMVVIILLLIALIILGCLMDSLSMILLVVPFFWPVLVELNGGLYQDAQGSGFSMSTEDLKIWFGILALIVVELGLITPPVGMNVFIISTLEKNIPLQDVFIGVTPFFLAEIIRVIVIFLFPALTLWLPAILQ